MSENTSTPVAEIEIEAEDTELALEDIVAELVTEVFGESETITPYKIHKVINGAFEALGAEKRIIPQYMYNYDRNGMIAKGIKGAKAYNKDQVTAFVNKFVGKHTK